VDAVITQTFDRALADQTAAAFMRRLSQALELRHLVIGYDTALGRGREADAARLTEIGKELGYSVQVVPALTDANGVISSTRIRLPSWPGTYLPLLPIWDAPFPLPARSSTATGVDTPLISPPPTSKSQRIRSCLPLVSTPAGPG
jgi:riboflavin kinase/FMN adenylyltransferase